MFSTNKFLKIASALFRRIWNDPVGASVIATGIAALLAGLPTYFIVGWPAIKEWFLNKTATPHWLLLLLSMVAVFFMISVASKILSKKENSRLNLINNALNDDYPITSLLREARNIAQDHRDNEMVKWIDQELKGDYTNLIDEEFPSYRRIYGDLQAFNPYHGWQPVQYANAKMRELLTYGPSGQDIGSIEKTVKTSDGKTLTFIHSPSQKQILMDALPGAADIRLIISRSSLEGILKAARQKIYEWASKIES